MCANIYECSVGQGLKPKDEITHEHQESDENANCILGGWVVVESIASLDKRSPRASNLESPWEPENFILFHAMLPRSRKRSRPDPSSSFAKMRRHVNFSTLISVHRSCEQIRSCSAFRRRSTSRPSLHHLVIGLGNANHFFKKPGLEDSPLP